MTLPRNLKEKGRRKGGYQLEEGAFFLAFFFFLAASWHAGS